MRDALAVNKLREDAAEKERKDKEGDEETGNLADGSHHGDDWNDEKTILIEELTCREGNIVADESSHITSMALASYEGGFESFAPGVATNKKEYNREGGANLKEEEAAAEERNVGREVSDEKGIDNVGKNREKGASDSEASDVKIRRLAFFFASATEDNDEDGGHNDSETNTLHGRDVFAENSDAEAERNERTELAEDVYISRVAGLKRFEIIDRADHIDGASENKAAGVIERQNEDGATEDGEQDEHRHYKAR